MIGDQIKIILGLFAGFLSKIKKLDSEQKILALINLKGQKTKIHLTPEIF